MQRRNFENQRKIIQRKIQGYRKIIGGGGEGKLDRSEKGRKGNRRYDVWQKKAEPTDQVPTHRELRKPS